MFHHTEHALILSLRTDTGGLKKGHEAINVLRLPPNLDGRKFEARSITDPSLVTFRRESCNPVGECRIVEFVAY